MADYFKNTEKIPVEYQKQLALPSGDEAKDVGDHLFSGNASVIDLTIAKIDYKEELKICDIGCGPGYSLLQMSKKIKSGKIIGIDPSKEMCDQAREHNRSEIDSGLVEIYQESTPKLHFEDNHFDYITMVNVIYFWKNIKPHLKELYRVLNNNGKLIIYILTRQAFEGKISEKDGVFIMHDKDFVQKVLKEIGFEIIECEKVSRNVAGIIQYGHIIVAIK